MIKVLTTRRVSVRWFPVGDFENTLLREWVFSSCHDDEPWWWSILGFQINILRT